MRLLSQISREYKGTKYEKFWVVIPSDLIESLGWKKGKELKAQTNKGKMTIEAI